MRDYAVHEEPKGGARGLRRLLLPFRWLLVRILRAVFQRLAVLLKALDTDLTELSQRQERTEQQVDALLSRGWDQSSLLRRLAALELQVEELSRQASSPTDAAPVGYFTPVKAPAAAVRREQGRSLPEGGYS
jgi:hypothetical protein